MTFRRPLGKRAWLGAVLAATLLCASGVAQATAFTITIKNTSTFAWSAGLLTFSPLMPIGATPTSGAGYTTYGYTTSACNVNSGDDGNASALATNLGLTLGTNAFLVPAIAVGATVTVPFNATAGQKLSYLADVYGSATEAEDDVIMMHVVGNNAALQVPLFDASGYPLASIAFELGGYDTNSTSATSGTASSCSPKCPTPASGCFVAFDNGTTGGNLPAQPAQPNLTLTWSQAMSGYTTDGIALGNLTSSTENQIVVLTEAGQYSSGYNPTATGRAVVMSRAAGATQSTFDATVVGHDFMGIPLIENLDGSGNSEYLVAEFSPLLPSPGAAVYARSGSSTTATWTSTGYGFPGFWNMGPMSADVRSDVGSGSRPEVIEASYTGDIAVLNAATGATVNSYSTFTGLGEVIYGHVAVGDVIGNGNKEIVGFGATTGKVFALNVPTGTGNVPMTVAWTGTPPTSIYAFGSGPAIGDLDGDGNPEIVVASASSGVVYAFDPRSSTTCKYKWTATGGFGYQWTSPVIADVDGDGVKEVVVFSSDSVLSILSRPSGSGSGCREGTLEWTYTVGNGGPAWFTPAIGQLSSAGGVDVVVASYNTLEVVNVTGKALAYRYVDPTAQFYPTAVIEAGAGGGAAQLYVSGWSNSKVYRFDTPTGSGTPVAWPAFMGGNTRTGAR